MRPVVLLISLFVSAPIIACFGQTKSMPVVVDPTIRIVKVSPSGSIGLEIGNPSKEPIKLWEDSNSWGAACWRVVRIRNGQTETFFQNPYQIFTANFPSTTEIAPGAHLEHTLDVNGGNWCGLGHCAPYNERGLGGKEIRFDAGDMIVVIYDVPPTKESLDGSVWHGVAAAFAPVGENAMIATNRSMEAIAVAVAFVLAVLAIVAGSYTFRWVFSYSLNGSALDIRALGLTVGRVPFSDIDHIEVIPFASLVPFSRSFRWDAFLSWKWCGYRKKVVAIKRRNGLVKRMIISPGDPDSFTNSLKAAFRGTGG